MKLSNTLTLDGETIILCLKHGRYETEKQRDLELG